MYLTQRLAVPSIGASQIAYVRCTPDHTVSEGRGTSFVGDRTVTVRWKLTCSLSLTIRKTDEKSR